MTQIDPALPRLIPEGLYTFEITSEPEKKNNQWGGFYWQFNFIVENNLGSHYKFSNIFNQTEDRYHDLLIALGGKRDAQGVVHLPDITFTGMKFQAEIRHVQSKTNDKVYDRLVNPAPLKEELAPAEETDFASEEVPI